MKSYALYNLFVSAANLGDFIDMAKYLKINLIFRCLAFLFQRFL